MNFKFHRIVSLRIPIKGISKSIAYPIQDLKLIGVGYKTDEGISILWGE